MAKGLRASVTKRNKSKLRSRVFGPTEDARTERLSAKLLELAQQPKATQDTEMLVDGQSSKGAFLEHMLWKVGRRCANETCTDQSTTTDVEDTEKAAGSAADGQSLTLPSTFTLSVPSSLSRSSPGDETSSEGGSDVEEVSMTEGEELFYAMLGLSGDIAGFTATGDLKMLFEH